ncbi:MAG TPA: 3-hydroxyacyl-CoA dehydrogenase/enoyl-CoA hydratase family protein [Kofleriaceae bacterium]|nr:3-hydroxyacyl-CoA dehydrogenase/enoyl-CoA hydratase family protein [Kofleriaceae bacterium]
MIVGVIGSGSIGPDLAYGFLSALARQPGARVYLVDIKREALEAGVGRIRGYAQKGVSRGKLSLKLAAAMEQALVPTLVLGDLAECDYVLEAASEDLAVKQAILAQLEQVVRPDCLIGFATSGLPRARIAANARHPARCFVNHPFFPAWRSLPVEVVLSGDDALGARMMATLQRLGKVPLVTADAPCFAADDIFCNYISEAARIVEEGVATPAQVDAIVHGAIGGGGPFNVMDATQGNLLTVHCQELMKEAPTGGAWFEPPAILRERGARPWHDRGAPGDSAHDPALAKTVLDRILAVLFGRTLFVVDEGICAPTDLDWMTRTALGFTKGLLDLAAEYGPARVHDLCARYAAAHPGFPVPASIAARTPVTFLRTVRVERQGEVGVVSVFRPEVKNALSETAVFEIAGAIDELVADDAIAGVVFTSYDRALAGADIGGIASLETPSQCRDICLRAYDILARVSAAPKPIVAAVDGPVLGGGAEFSMACHARVVGPRLVLGQPEVNLGIIPGYGGTQRLPRLIGDERALELMRTGRSVGAAEACAWGWASGEPASDVLAAAVALIRAHVAGEVTLGPVDPAPMVMSASVPAVDIGHRSLAIDAILVDVVRRGLVLPLDEGLVLEAEGFGRCKATVDMDIGIKNFMQNGPRVPAAFLNE